MVFRVQFKGKMKDTSQRAFPDQPFQPASSARVCLDDEDAASDLVPAMSDRGIIRELRGYCPSRMRKNPLLPRLLKKVQMQGGARCEVRGVLSPYVAAPRERANAADGLFSAAC